MPTSPFAGITPELLERLTPTAWIVANGFVNENQQPIEFTKHRFLIEPFDDMHPDIVVKKSAQIGFSVLAILKSIWLAKEKGINTIYVLPTQDIVKSFVNPKVDPLIAGNPGIQKLVSKDSVTLKQVGKRFIHYKGSSSQREAISTSADLLVIDEYDRCMDMSVLNTYDSRLQASEYGWRWRFSNPSAVGFGVDMLYEQSDQRHWFVECHHCGHNWYIDFEQDGKCHYVDQQRKIYACGKCNQEISDADRQNGKWIAKYPGRARHGYWFSQMMAPWVSAARILEQKEESSVEFFYNFVLGKAYTPSDLIVNRETILRACSPGNIPRVGVAIGVDQNANEQIYVCMTSQGVFDYGKVNSWEDIEHLKLMYNATVVCDPAPYPTHPKIYADKYSDWYICYFKEMNSIDVVQWKDSVVYADRTKLLDTVATEIAGAKLLFRQRPYELEAYIADWQNIYRTTVEQPDGKVKSTWLKKEGKNSDYSFATCLIAGTMVTTDKGDVPIESIVAGDMVLTRSGYCRVIDAGCTGIKKVVRADFTNGVSIIGTPTHRFYTHNRGFVELQHLLPTDILDICQRKAQQQKSTLSLEDVSITATQTQDYGNTASTGRLRPFLKQCFTVIRGNITTVAAYQRVTRYITGMVIRLIINLGIYSVCRKVITSSYIVNFGSRLQKQEQHVLNLCILKKRMRSLLHGVGRVVITIIRSSGVDCNKLKNLPASCVKKLMKQKTGATMPTVLKVVTKNTGVRLIQVTILEEKERVYNLSVEGRPEYYANGILVHNCYARIALSKMLGSAGSGFLVEPELQQQTKVTDTARGGQVVLETLNEAVADTLADLE